MHARKLQDLIALIRRRYPDWSDFSHPGFVTDEIEYKQATIAKAETIFNRELLDRLLSAGDTDTIIENLQKLVRDNNLLWRRMPSKGDTAVLHHPDLDIPSFCTQIRNLLYGDRTSAERLQAFSDYLGAQNLPNKWPFPTYLLFITHPKTEIFVKPHTAQWFLKFMGATEKKVSSPPTAQTYAAILENAHALYESLQPYGAQAMVDVQSFIWVCSRESKKRVAGLNTKGQVELDVPQTEPEIISNYSIQSEASILREPDAQQIPVSKKTPHKAPTYSLDEIAANSGYAKALLERWRDALQRKGQAVFYGPPGTGKTFMAQELARHLVGGGDGFWELVQFHPAYTYEDFMQGIRPLSQLDGSLRYEMVPGRFLNFCHRAQSCQESCVLIIDEINRANIASLFGELMYALEYRETAVPLAGGGLLSIPKNILIIGTMNTADRSIALVDHALRRRFAFIHMHPNNDVLRHFHAQTNFPIEKLIIVLNRLNNHISDPHYEIGHSFFLDPKLTQNLQIIWQMEIEPYLEEYFFDQTDRIDAFRWEQINDQFK